MNSILVEDEGRFKFSCMKCNYKHDDPKVFQLHANSHISQSLRCDNGFFETDHKTMFAIHQQEHSSNDKMEPEFIVPAVSRLKPIRKGSNMEKGIKCQKCDFRTKSSGNLKLHSLVHQPQLYQCIVCDYKASFEKLLDLHEESHTPSDFRKKLSCHYCVYVTYRKCSLFRHLLAHNEQEFECSTCDCKNETECEINEHWCRKKHIMKCQICGFQTGSKVKFTRHVNTHLADCYNLEDQHNIQEQNLVKRRRTPWTLADKREIYWCYMFARHRIFGKNGTWDREKKMLMSRGIVEPHKVEYSANVALFSLVAHIKRNAVKPNAKLSMDDLRKIEDDVNNYVRSHIKENYSTESNA